MMVQTEIGLLPEDWEVVRLENVGSFTKGTGICRNDSQTGKIPAVRYGELYTDHNNYIKQFKSFISSEVAKTARKMKTGCILFTASGETKEDIGKAVAFLDDIEAYAGGDLIILNPKADYCSLYLGYTLNSLISVRQRAMVAQGDSVVHITTSAIQDTAIPVPYNLEEQQNIASALSSIDKLIDDLGRTIHKKQLIREGAMEELLSGKKRLPGFTDEWVEKEIGTICIKMRRGSMLNSSEFQSGYIPVIAAGIEPAGYHSIANRKGNTITVSSSGANAGFIQYHVYPIFAGDCFTIDSSDDYDIKFIYYALKSRQKEINKLQTGGAQPHVHPKDLEPFIIPYTSCIKEQHAIADILTSMDDEISVLQIEKTKYEQIRFGMMEELLTGKKRLK